MPTNSSYWLFVHQSDVILRIYMLSGMRCQVQLLEFLCIICICQHQNTGHDLYQLRDTNLPQVHTNIYLSLEWSSFHLMIHLKIFYLNFTWNIWLLFQLHFCAYEHMGHSRKTQHNIHESIDCHYSDVIMGTMVSLITSLTSVYSTVHPGAEQRKHQSSASQAFVRGIHRRPVNSPHKWPVTRKMLPFDDVIMCNSDLDFVQGSVAQSVRCRRDD